MQIITALVQQAIIMGLSQDKSGEERVGHPHSACVDYNNKTSTPPFCVCTGLKKILFIFALVKNIDAY